MNWIVMAVRGLLLRYGQCADPLAEGSRQFIVTPAGSDSTAALDRNLP